MRLVPTLSRQCWLFAVGSAFFATATGPGFVIDVGPQLANLLCAIGAVFFTTAAWMQLHLSEGSGRLAEYSAAVQLAGTVLFNVSTCSALWPESTPERRHLVWTPDAVGSVAFLLSAVLAIAALTAAGARRGRGIAWLNMAGCIAFGVSAVAGYLRQSGAPEDQWLTNRGTFAGALCFLPAALLALPRFRDPGPALRQSGA